MLSGIIAILAGKNSCEIFSFRAIIFLSLMKGRGFMKEFIFDLQRFAITNALSSVAKTIASIGEEITTDGKKYNFWAVFMI